MQPNTHSSNDPFSRVLGTDLRGQARAKAERGHFCPPQGRPAAQSHRSALLFLGMLCCFVGGVHQVAAQPRITVQPRNASVLLGQDAQFTVTASGVGPLTYQWRFDGHDLADTTSCLRVTGVTLSNLGRYDVVVSNNAGAVTSAPACLLLARWTELVTFGRSLEVPICGGLAWPSYLADSLGVRLRHYDAHAITPGFPFVPSAIVHNAITRYLSTNRPTTSTLVGLWAGGCDLWVVQSPVEEAAANQLALTRRLVEAGVRSVLMPRCPVPELVPSWVARFPSLTSETVVAYDALLDIGLKELQTEFSVTIYRPDTFAFFTALAVNPAAYGFRELPGTDFLCDELHYTSAVHDLMSQQFHASLTPLVRIDSTVRMPSGGVLLNWSGGSRPFRIERTTDLLSGQWEPVGEPGFNSSATMKPTNPQEFFRVLSLGQ